MLPYALIIYGLYKRGGAAIECVMRVGGIYQKKIRCNTIYIQKRSINSLSTRRYDSLVVRISKLEEHRRERSTQEFH